MGNSNNAFQESGETEESIQEALVDYFNDDPFATLVRSARTYQDAGILTNDAGIVLRLEDGSEFQVTVVRSR